MSDLCFDCPCGEITLQVDASGAGVTIECPRCAAPVLIPDAPHGGTPIPTREQISKTQKIELPLIPPSRSSTPLTPRHSSTPYSQTSPSIHPSHPVTASQLAKEQGRIVQRGTLIAVVIAVLVLGIAAGMMMALRH